MRTLVAEDELISRLILTRFLECCGPVDAAMSGREAVQAHQLGLEESNPYDLICLDIMMPDMNGLDALQAIRETEDGCGIMGDDRVKVIMTTALSDQASKDTAYDRGCQAYLVKPIDRRELLHRIRELGIFEQKTAT